MYKLNTVEIVVKECAFEDLEEIFKKIENLKSKYLTMGTSVCVKVELNNKRTLCTEGQD